MNISRLMRILILVSAAALAIDAAVAQEFPSKTVRLVVPFPPGGAVDILGRAVGPPLSRALGQNVVVDNRPGGNTVIGAELVVRAPADGHTLLLMAPSFTINPFVSADIARALQLPEVSDGLNKLGLSPAAMSPVEFDAFMRAEMEKNGKIVRALNLKVD